MNTANEHGVFGLGQHEVVEGHCKNYHFPKGWRVRIYLAQAGENDWRYSVNVRITCTGVGSFPSTSGRSHQNRTEAFFAAVEEAKRCFKAFERIGSDSIDEQEINGGLTWLDQQRQLTLF